MSAAPQKKTAKLPAGWLQNGWPYWAGGIAIAAANTVLILFLDRPWGITSTMATGGARVLGLAGFSPQKWTYFGSERADVLESFTWLETGLWLNLGVIAGAALSSLWYGEWKLRRPRSWRVVGLALAGGLIMGYGARLALGCNAGALLGGIPSLSLHGWLFALLTFIGAMVGLKLFRHWL